tara:strand:+ start:216 stop:2291 length:2076 start_codon:yes stop_codon:yes gene_type:complete
MSTIKISELATGAVTLESLFAFADNNGIAFKGNVNDLGDAINTLAVSGMKAAILTTDASPLEDGLYPCSESGTYTNFGGLIIDISSTLSFISVSETQTVFAKIEIPITFLIDSVPTLASTNAVESGGVFEFVSDKTFYDFAGNYTELGKFIRAALGTLEPNASYDSTDYIDCAEKDVIEVLLPNNGTAGIAFYDSSNVFISGKAELNSSGNTIFIEVPINATKFRVCKLVADNEYLLLYINGSPFTKNEQQRAVDGFGKDLSDSYANTGSYVSALDGATISNASYEYTNFIECEFGEILYLRLPDSNTSGIAFYDSSNVFISGRTRKFNENTKTLINIPLNAVNFKTCKLIADETFLYQRSVNSDLKSYADINGIGGGVDFNELLAQKDNIFLSEGTYTIDTTITNLTGKVIQGVRGKTIIKASSSLVKLFDFTGVSNCTLRGLEIVGTGANIDWTDTTDISTIDLALSENGAGTKYGVYLKSCSRINIEDCIIRNFDFCGIYGETLGNSYDNGATISNCFINNNYIGIKSADAWEYSTFSANHINNNQIGFINGSGNNDIMGGSISKNVVNLIVNNLHVNNSHGSCVGTKLNHATVMCLIVDDISVGFTFTAIQCHETPTTNIYVRDSFGVVISSSIIKNGFTIEDGGGVVISSNCIRVTGQTINKIGTTYVKSLGNIYLDGSDNSGIND